MSLRIWRSIGVLLAVVVATAGFTACGKSSGAEASQSSDTVESVNSISIGEIGGTPTSVASPDDSNVPNDSRPSDTTNSGSDFEGVEIASAQECPVKGVDPIEFADLPPEAIDTLRLIASDGPFPFDRDGVTFQNRERLLPKMKKSYYREYTVIDPSQDDRGPRRIVTGDCGEAFYTSDHYDSFGWIQG